MIVFSIAPRGDNIFRFCVVFCFLLNNIAWKAETDIEKVCQTIGYAHLKFKIVWMLSKIGLKEKIEIAAFHTNQVLDLTTM